MKLRQLFSTEEERAVSPVIGVILMVAITVILAAVIGTFVLGLGDQVQQTAPNSNIAFDYDSATGDLEVTHDGGDSIPAENLVMTGDLNGAGQAWSDTGSYGEGSTISAGDQVTVHGDGTTGTYNWSPTSGDTVRVVWRGEGDQSSTLRSYTV